MVPQPKIAYDIGFSVKGAGVGLFLGSNGLPIDVIQVNVMQQSGMNISFSAIPLLQRERPAPMNVRPAQDRSKSMHCRT